MTAPFRPAAFAAPAVAADRDADGTWRLSSTLALPALPRQVGEVLRRHAAAAPDRTFLAERRDGGWRRVSYAEARRAADAIGQSLRDRGLGPDRPVMILSGNSIDHALLTLGAMQVGVPVAPVSPAYSLQSRDCAKVRMIFDLVRPALVFAQTAAPFARALAALPRASFELVTSDDAAEADAGFADLLASWPDADTERAFAAVGPQNVAKYLFTSGSTGTPKGVVNTQAMLVANQAQLVAVAPVYAGRPPVVLDWLPWNHTFGGNHNFNLVLFQGGTLFIDDGRPTPDGIARTVANLREVSPTAYFNVPVGYGALLPYLEADADLAERFFRDLDVLFYAGSALSADLWARLEAVSVRTQGRRVAMVTSFGSSESAPLCTSCHWPTEGPGNIGLPVPGVELKLVPSGDKLEIRAKGPNLFPGYLGRPDLTEAAFDAEGFYRFGDAVRLVDPAEPSRGLMFDGRVAEDFKLSSGTWVHCGRLRVEALAAAAPVLQDAVVAGHDRDSVGLLGFPNLVACRELAAGLPADAGPADLLAATQVVAALRDGLAAHNRAYPGSSTRIARVLLLEEPPQVDADEITDKGYINQRAVLARRAAAVERLFAAEPDEGVVVVG